jgi:hypothetical protein
MKTVRLSIGKISRTLVRALLPRVRSLVLATLTGLRWLALGLLEVLVTPSEFYRSMRDEARGRMRRPRR